LHSLLELPSYNILEYSCETLLIIVQLVHNGLIHAADRLVDHSKDERVLTRRLSVDTKVERVW